MALQWGSLSPLDRLVNVSMVEPRAYQINIIRSVLDGRNALVVLPTGLGKTLIAVFAIANAVGQGKKAILLSPTKPLCEQHHASLVSLLNIDRDRILLLTGSLTGVKREELERSAKVISATPQTVANDLKRGRLSLDDFGVVVFDECHRAVGRYAYTYIADECKARGVSMIGMTASPGSDRKKVMALVDALGVENIEMRTTTDTDVAPYVMQKDITTRYVECGPVVTQIAGMLKPIAEEHLSNLYSHGLSPFRRFDNLPKGRLLEIGNNIMKITAPNYKFMALYDYIYTLNTAHAYDLATTEGLRPFVSYLEGLDSKANKSRGVRAMLGNKAVVLARKLAKDALDRGEEHPKMLEAVSLIRNELRGRSVIVFAQYRSTIAKIAEMLNACGVGARAFVGKRDGTTIGQQQEAIKEFRDGRFRVLVATSIGEEGLDIPSVDAVVFYEPVPSEIRNIQRRGRAGRMRFGQVFILVARGTRDEAYLMISRMREKRMHELIMRIKRDMALGRLHGPGGKGAGQRLLG